MSCNSWVRAWATPFSFRNSLNHYHLSMSYRCHVTVSTPNAWRKFTGDRALRLRKEFQKIPPRLIVVNNTNNKKHIYSSVSSAVAHGVIAPTPATTVSTSAPSTPRQLVLSFRESTHTHPASSPTFSPTFVAA